MNSSSIIYNTSTYIYWLCWSVIVGGMLLAGPLLAPLAFKIMPLAVAPDIAQYAHSFASTLFTLFFVKYFPIVAFLFFLMSMIDQWKVNREWKLSPKMTSLKEVLIVSGNIVWFWISLSIVPEMETMVMDLETWNQIEVREAFSILHNQSQRMSEIGLLITMILPFFSSRTGMKNINR